MINPELLNFIKQQIDKGASKEEIKRMLLANNWTSQEVEEGFGVVSSHGSQTSQPTSVAPNVAIKIDEQNCKLPGVFQLLKESWLIYHKKFLTLTGIMAIPVALSFLGNIALSQKETSNGFFIIGIIVSLASFFFLLLIVPVLIFSVKKEEIGVKESYKKGLKIFSSYLWVYVLSIFIITGGFLLFIIPGFLFSVWFSLAIFVLVFEEKKGFSALFKSKHLISGKFWVVLWRFLASCLIIGFLLAAILAIFLIIPIFLIQGDIEGVAQKFWYIFGYLLPLFISPFALIYASLIYKKLTEIKAAIPYQEPSRKNRIKYILIGILATPIITSGLFFNLMNLISRDEPPPDDRDLQLPIIKVSEKDNAFYALFIKDTDKSPLFKSKNNIYQPKSAVNIDNIISGKEWDNNFAEDITKNNKEALGNFEKAVQFPIFQDPNEQDPETYGLMRALPPLNDLRNLGKISSVKAIYLFHQGKEEDAFEQAIKTVKLGQMIKDSQGSLIQYLVGGAVKNSGLNSLRTIISKTSLPSKTLKTYIQKLEEFKNNEEGLVKAFKAEYISMMNSKEKMVDPILTGKATPKEREKIKENLGEDFGILETGLSRFNFYYKPNQTKRFHMEQTLAQVNNVKRDCGDIKQLDFKYMSLDDSIWGLTKLTFTENAVGKVLFDIVAASFNNLVYKKCNEDFSVAGAQLLLALKAYQTEKGKLPNLLGELVPTYIAEIPKDPFSGGQIKYSKDKKIIYSVGEDLKDSGGSEKEDLISEPTFKIKI